MNTIFDIEQKEDSPEKLENVAGVPSKYYLKAEEFNDVARKALESAIDHIQLDFSWSNDKNHVKFTDYKFIKKIQLLVVNFSETWILKNTDEVWLLIDRYKGKRVVRTNGQDATRYKESGYKHPAYPDYKHLERPSEILITDNKSVVDFGQEYYFKFFGDENPTVIATGMGQNNSTESSASIYLRFRIKVKKGDAVFYSKSKGMLKMRCRRDSKADENFFRIHYNLV